MNFQNSEKLFTGRLFRYLSRILILYIVSTVFKSFDQSFIRDFRILGLRSQLFSLYFVLYGLLVWEGATWLSRRIERRVINKNVFARLLPLVSILVIYGLLAAFGFAFVYAILDIVLFHRYEAWESFSSLSYDLIFGLFMFYLLILSSVGITFYYREWSRYQVQAERLKSENIQARYDALRNQIDPHFFFNSLSVLTNLVYKSPELSARYITQLSKIYRYILDKKFENLVTIQTELDFLESYLFLLRIRHQDGLQYQEEIDEFSRMKGMIPPASLQMLVENAIRHNKLSAADPLTITIRNEDGHLVVSNPVKKKLNEEPFSGIGLENIKKRYELISSRNIEICQTPDMFIVRIPIITNV